MNKRQVAALRRFENAVGFGRAYKLAGARAARLIAELDACVVAIKQCSIDQTFGGVTRTNHAHAGHKLREKLRRGHMLPIRRDVLLLCRGEANLEAAMVVPHISVSSATLVAAARRMAKALTKRHRAFLVREGVSAELLAGLTTSADRLSAWEASTTAAIRTTTRATRDLLVHLAEGVRLETAIEGIVMGEAVDRPQLWGFWVHERRKRKKMGRPRKPRG